jgi:hypothetical protein
VAEKERQDATNEEYLSSADLDFGDAINHDYLKCIAFVNVSNKNVCYYFMKQVLSISLFMVCWFHCRFDIGTATNGTMLK